MYQSTPDSAGASVALPSAPPPQRDSATNPMMPPYLPSPVLIPPEDVDGAAHPRLSLSTSAQPQQAAAAKVMGEGLGLTSTRSAEETVSMDASTSTGTTIAAAAGEGDW